ncbi:hypothetical protein [Meiothermus granaticius]|uniref:Uncharacterized protein n=1 Tax=Meiothermus granaticius NBRC 107808 TaxID=1227551 RepID=A0A399FCP7_9DEIN|nr:hypothetical protein [Meiothermus granaticius]RIH94013.1 hypothetical protein Mgrana_00099 [Meiothermus granaticius NBRC 107808]GEM88158.1 hypothetical protein MGR01S_27830 [Meiothermus granaticius NBRC 107808]
MLKPYPTYLETTEPWQLLRQAETIADAAAESNLVGGLALELVNEALDAVKTALEYGSMGTAKVRLNYVRARLSQKLPDGLKAALDDLSRGLL